MKLTWDTFITQLVFNSPVCFKSSVCSCMHRLNETIKCDQKKYTTMELFKRKSYTYTNHSSSTFNTSVVLYHPLSRLWAHKTSLTQSPVFFISVPVLKALNERWYIGVTCIDVATVSMFLRLYFGTVPRVSFFGFPFYAF